jgi:glycosyltransferase involved in cell wall biosynthesis
MKSLPRVAFFTCSYHEVNGVAHTSRHLKAFAQRHKLPFLCICAGPATRCFREGTVRTLELKRGPVSMPLDEKQNFDFLFWQHVQLVRETVRAFQPDIIHITGPSDVGQLGVYAARSLGVPLVASWHTNLHEFLARRYDKLVDFLPTASRMLPARWLELRAMDALVRFYRMARVVIAPNEELADLLRRRTARPISLMRRGVDTDLFSPAKRESSDGFFRLGYVGRLRPEKNVRFLAELERNLVSAGKSRFRFLIVGDGSEREWLERNLRFATFTGVLEGEELARAYANIDLLTFPSRTDTFGNVVLESLASGTPAIVTSHGGPKFIVESGVSGHVASDDRDFLDAILAIMSDRGRYKRMREAARRAACAYSWEGVFDRLYQTYETALMWTGAAWRWA